MPVGCCRCVSSLFIIFDGDDAVVGVRRVYVSKVFVYLTIIGVRRIPLARMATMWPYDVGAIFLSTFFLISCEKRKKKKLGEV